MRNIYKDICLQHVPIIYKDICLQHVPIIFVYSMSLSYLFTACPYHICLQHVPIIFIQT